MQHPFFYFFLLVIHCRGQKDLGFVSSSGCKLHCAARVGSDDLGYRPGSGFNFKPVLTFNAPFTIS